MINILAIYYQIFARSKFEKDFQACLILKGPSQPPTDRIHSLHKSSAFPPHHMLDKLNHLQNEIMIFMTDYK